MHVTNVQLSAWRRVSHTEIYPHQALHELRHVLTTTFTVDLEMVYFCDSAADSKFSVTLLNSAEHHQSVSADLVSVHHTHLWTGWL